jgi:uroporphyrinogen-III synthase
MAAAPALRGPKVWVTRPEPDAGTFAETLKERGFAPIIAPLVEMSVLSIDVESGRDALQRADAVVITSRNALRAAESLGLLPAVSRRPVIAVGPGTANLAAELGCQQVTEAPGRAADIVDMLLAGDGSFGRPGAAIAYLRGAEVAFDLEAALAASDRAPELIAFMVYAMRPTGAPDAGLVDLIQRRELHAVTLFSPRVAGIYAQAVAQYALAEAVAPVIHYCLSDRVAAQISHLQLTNIAIPEKPNLQEMLEVMGGPTAQSMH